MPSYWIVPIASLLFIGVIWLGTWLPEMLEHWGVKTDPLDLWLER